MILARLFVLVGGLLVLALTAALVGPYFIDWTSYRADFEREASAILGRKVTVEGEATARILPFPSVTFSDVSVGGGPDGKAAMTIETFSMDAELAPFMSGEVHIFDMRMVRPRGVVDVADDGSIDWAVRPSSPFDAARISVERLTITEGRIEVRHTLSGRTHLLSEVNATVSATALSGPWRFDGTLRLDGHQAALSGATGPVDAEDRMRLRVRLEPVQYPMTVEADGAVAARDGSLVYAGTFRVDQSQPKPGSDAASQAAAREAGPGNRLKGNFSMDNAGLALEEVRFETGPLVDPYTADGSASISFGAEPRFSVSGRGAQIRFDETLGGEGAAGLTLSQRVKAIETALTALPTPVIPGSIDIDLPAVVVGDTTIRDVRLEAEPGEGGWTLKSSAATLPGRTTVEASGFISTGDDFRFTGSLLLAVAQPSGFAAWVSRDIDEAIRKLPAAGFSAKVDMTEQRQAFEDLELVLGNAKFHGAIDARQPEGVRPSVLLKLEGDALDVDGMSAFASLFVSDKGVARFAETDVDFQVKAGPVTVAGLSADTLDTAMRLRSGDLEIDRLLVGGLAGAAISATGRIQDFPESPTGNLDASIVSPDLAPLIRLAAAQAPNNAALRQLLARVDAHGDLFADSKIDVVVSAAANDDDTTGVAVSLQGMAGGTAVSATLSGKGRADALASSTLTFTLSARDPDATSLLALAGLPALPLGLVGDGEATLSLDGVPSRGLDTRFSLTGDRFVASFDGTSALGGDGVSAKGEVRLEADDIEPWMMTTGTVFPGMGTGLPVALKADADIGAGLLVLSEIGGTIDDNTVAGDINADIREGTPNLTGAVSVDVFDLEPFAAMLLGDGVTVGEGGAWASEPFKPQATMPLIAELDLSADTLSAGAVLQAYDSHMTLRIDGEGMRVDQLTSKLFGGDMAASFELKNNAGTGLLSGQMQLRGADLELALPKSGLTGVGSMSATLSSNGKSADGLVAALSGSGTATLGGVRIEGLNGAALPVLLSRADAIGRDIDAAKTAGFAPAVAADGAFEAAGTDFAFTVAGGVARASAVSLANEAATVKADVRGDANTLGVSIAGEITYNAGDEALAGSEPELRFTVEGAPGATTRTFDSAPLAQFLTQRALEREQARVEAMQAVLIEKQRLRREVRYYAALQTERDRIAEEKRKAEEEERRRVEEEARRKLEAEQAAKAAEEARLQAEAQARAAAEAKAVADAEAKRRADEEARRLAAQEAQAPERKPAPAARPATKPDPLAEPETRKLEPFGIENFLKSLQGG